MNETLPSGRVVLIGLDGMEVSLLDELASKGEAPAFARLRQTAAWVGLDEGAARDTGVSWEVACSGRSCERNGRLSAVDFDPATYEVRQIGATQEPFWANFDLNGTTVVIDVPYTSALERERMVTVAGWGSHDPGYPRSSWPKGLLAEIDERFGPHPACNNDYAIVWNDVERTVRLGRALVEGVAKRVEVTEWLLERFPDWELLVVVMSEAHGGSEAFWHGMDRDHPLASHESAPHARESVYAITRALDSAIARLIESTPDAIHLIVGTGGMTTNNSDVSSMVLLPELMYRREVGKTKLYPRRPVSAVEAMVPGQRWSAVIERRHRPGWREDVWKRAPTAARFASRMLRRTFRRDSVSPNQPEPPELVAWGLFDAGIPVEDPRSAAEIGIPSSHLRWHPATTYASSWKSMRSFALPSFYDGRIRVNLVGRETSGRVPLSEFDLECSEIENLLRACTDRWGQPVVSHFERPGGDPLLRLRSDCDLLVKWAQPVDAIIHPRFGTIGPVPYRRPGGHGGSPGFVACDGASAGTLSDEGSIRPLCDLAASVRSLFGLAPDPLLEGVSFFDPRAATRRT